MGERKPVISTHRSRASHERTSKNMPSLQVQVETLKLHTHLVTALTELDQEQVTEGLSTRSSPESWAVVKPTFSLARSVS